MTALWRSVKRQRRARVAMGVLAVAMVSALGAELIASDLPLAVRRDGVTYLLPCLVRPRELAGANQAGLAQTSEWMLPTPIPFGPNETMAVSGERRSAPPPWAPDARHWFGTDELGRDVFARIIHGSRSSLLIALVTVMIAVAVGVLLGSIAGLAGGAADALISRIVEVAMTFPLLFFLLALASVWRTQSLVPLVVSLGLTRWPQVARLVRAEVLRLKTLDFVLAARAMGASRIQILLRHLLPHVVSPVAVSATFGMAGAVLLETTLSFLGLGVAPPTASWGDLLAQAHRNLLEPGAWWLAVFPGACIAATVLSVNAMGEALSGALSGTATGDTATGDTNIDPMGRGPLKP